MTLRRLALGREGERRAARFLEGLGYRVLERGFRTRLGEVDLVLDDAGTIVFAEVKTRSGGAFGAPEEAVDARKRSRIVKAALAYLQSRGIGQAPVRFDVVAVTPGGVRHIPDAFGTEGWTR